MRNTASPTTRSTPHHVHGLALAIMAVSIAVAAVAPVPGAASALPTGDTTAAAASTTGDQHVSTVLIIDSSGSMDWNDPGWRRLDAAHAYLTVSLASDEVAIVDFDHYAYVASTPLPVGTGRSVLANAIATIDSNGETNLGAGLRAGCDLLTTASGARRAAIFLTDGDGDYSNEAQCFASNGWPVFAIGLGPDVNQPLLGAIAAGTGGQYLQLTRSTNLVCEFQRIRSLIAGLGPTTCDQSALISQGQTFQYTEQVDALAGQVTFTTTWDAGDLRMALTSPSGRQLDASTVADDVTAASGATFETISVANPEPGGWGVAVTAMSGAGTQQYTYSSVQVPHDLAAARPITTSCAVTVNMVDQGDRIRFEPRTASGRVGGSLGGGSNIRWKAWADAGQFTDLTLDSADDNVGFVFYAPSGRVVAEAYPGSGRPTWWGTLPESGDYTIEVRNVGSHVTYYELRLAIDESCAHPAGTVARMQFAPGTDSLAAAGTISGSSVDTWVLHARGGQYVEATVISPDGATTFDVYSADGTVLTPPEHRSTWAGTLPGDGDFRIAVRIPSGSSTTYEITVRIT